MASRKNNVFISDLTVDKVKVNSSLINNKELVSIGPLICHNTLSVHLDSKIDGVLAVDGGTYIDNILSVHGPVFVRDETLFSLLDVRDVYYYLENTYFERYISVAEGVYSNSLGVKMNTDMGGNLSIGGPLFISSYQSIALNSDILGSQRIGENLSINGLSFITEQLSVGGDTYIYNTLSVESPVTLHDTLSVDGLLTLHDNISVNGYATLHDTLSVGENVYLNYDLSIGHEVYIEGYLSVNNIATFKNKLSIADDSYISKTLSVQEPVYLADELSIYGDTNIYSTLSIGDITYINSSLSITDNLFIEDQLSIQSCVYIQDSLSIGYNSYTQGDISIQGDSYLKGIISVDGFSTFVDTISLGDIAYLSQELSISGHTNIRDTLSVNDNVYLKSKLSVNDNIILKSDLSVDGLSYLKNSISVYENAYFVNKLSVFDNIITSNNLSVSNNTYLQSNISINQNSFMNGKLSVNDNVHFNNSLSVNGVFVASNKLSIAGDTYIRDNLSISSNIFVRSKLSVFQAVHMSNNLSVQGLVYSQNQLSVFGQTTLNDKLSVSGRTFLSDTLSVSNTSYLNNQLSVFGSATLNDLLSVSNRTFLSNTLSVAGIQYNSSKLSISGDTNIKDTLSVLSNVYLNTKLSVSGDTNIKDTLSISGIIYDANQLSVFGQTTLNDKLSVSGRTFLSDTLSVNNISYLKNQLSVFGSATMNDLLSVSNRTFLSNTLSVAGIQYNLSKLSISGDTNIKDTLSIAGNVYLNTKLSVSGDTNIKDSLSISGIIYDSNQLSVFGQTTLNDKLSVSGKVFLNDTLSVYNIGYLKNQLSILGMTTIGDILSVNGSSFIKNTLSVYDSVTLNNSLSVYGNARIDGLTLIDDDLSVSGIIYGDKEISIGGIGYLTNSLSLNGRLTVIGDIDITGSFFNNGIIQNTNSSTVWLFGPDNSLYYVAGNVGIGTIVPAYKLDVRGGDSFLQGNSFIQGRLSISNRLFVGNQLSIFGDTIIQNTLSVGSRTALLNTLDVSGQTNIKNNLSVFGPSFINNSLSIVGPFINGSFSSINGNFFSNSNLSIQGNATMNGSLSVNGSSYINNLLSISNDLQVGRFLNVNNLSKFNNGVQITNLTTMNGKLSINGDATISSYLSIGDDAYFKKKTTIDGETRINGATFTKNVTTDGFHYIKNNVSIGGIATIDDSLIINFDTLIGNYVSIGNDTNITTNLYAGNVGVTGTVSINGSENVYGDVYINGYLSVNSPIYLNGDTNNSNQYTSGLISVNSDIYVTNNLDVNNNTSLHNTLSVYGTFYLEDQLSVGYPAWIDSNLIVSNDTNLNNNLYIQGNSELKGTLSINNNLTINGVSSISGDTFIDGSLNVGKKLTTKGIISNGNVDISGNQRNFGFISISSDGVIDGSLYVRNRLSISNIATLSNKLSVNGDSYFSSNLSIYNSAYVNGLLSINGVSFLSGVVSVGNNEYILTDLSIGGSEYLANNISIGGSSYFKGVVDLSNNLVLRNHLSVNGNSYINGVLSIGGDTFLNGLTDLSNVLVRNNLSVYQNIFIQDNLSIQNNIFTNNINSANNQNININSNLSISGIVKVNNNILLNKSTIDNSYLFDMSGNARVDGNLHVSGNLTIDGSAVTINTESLTVVDGVIQLAANNTLSDDLPIGVIGHYLDASNVVTHSGFLRSPNTKDWWLVNNYPTNVTTSFTGTARNNLSTLNVGDIKTNDIISRGNTDISGVLTALNYVQHNWNSNKLGNPIGLGNIGSDASGILIKLATLSTNSDNDNGGSVYIHGTIGSYGGNGSGIISLSVGTRVSVNITGSLFVQDYATCQQRNDFMLYQETDSTYSLYLRCYLYNKFDFMVSGNGTGINLITPTNTSTTSPTGTLYTIGGNYSLLKQCLITYNNGNVGIGTTAPSQKLDVNGNINFNGSLYQNGTLYVSSQWSTNVNNIFYNTGNVGIGTNNPSAKLDVVGDIKATITYAEKVTHTYDTSGIPNDGNKWFKIAQGYGLTYGVFFITWTTGGEHGTIKFSVGTNYNDKPFINLISSSYFSSSPIQEIRLSLPTGDIYGTNFIEIYTETNFVSNNPINFDIYLLEERPSGNISLFSSKTAGTTTGYTYYSLPVSTIINGINTNGATNVTSNSGNVGIGTNNPLYKIDINGQIGLQDRIFGYASGGNLFWLGLKGSGTDSQRVAIGIAGDSSTTGLITGIQFQTNNTNRMFIDSNGNVGIGTNNPSSRFHVYNTNTNEIYITNDSTGTTTFSSLRLKNSGGSQGILFFNSTTRTDDGGANTLTLRNDAGTLRLQSTGAVVSGANNGIEITGANVNLGYKALNTSLVTISGLTIGTTFGSLKNGYNSTSSYASSVYTWNIGALAGYGYIDIAGDGNTTMNISGLYKFYPNTYYKISITAKANKTSSACYLEAPNSSYTFGNSFTMTTSYQTFTFEGITSSALAYDGAGTYNNNMRFAIYDSAKTIVVNINAFSVQTMSVNGNGSGGVKMMNDNAKIIIGDGVSNVGDQGLEINTGWINSSNYNEHVPLRIQTRGNNAFLVNTAGNVGIGTTNPSGAKLDIYHNNTNVLQLSNFSNSNCALTIFGHQLGASSSITQKSAASTDLSLQLYNQTPYASYSGGTTESFIFYQKNSGGGISSPLYITRDLNVIAYQIGIGTNNPQNNLHVANTNAIVRIGNDTVGTAADTTTYGLERSRNSIYFTGYRDIVANKIGAKIVCINKQTHNDINNRHVIQSNDIAFFTTPPASSGIDNTLERLRITDSGNVGIGTNNPVASLTLNGTSTTNGIVLTNNSANDATRSISGGIVSNEICGLSSMTTNGAGSDAGQLRLSAGGGTNTNQKTFIDMYGYGVNTANSYMALGTAGTERMRILYSGYVGIGTNSPYSLLALNSVYTVAGARTDYTNKLSFATNFHSTGSSPNGTLTLGTATGHSITFLPQTYGDVGSGNAGWHGKLLFDFENSGGDGRYPLTLTSKNKVGIGSSSPSFPLTIGYSGTNTLATSPNKNFGLEIYNSNASGNQNTPNLILFTDYNTTQGAIGGYRENYSSHYRSGLVFYTNNQPVGYVQSQPGNTTNASNSLTEMMRINPDGNVGIGTNNPQSALHVVGSRAYGPGITKGIHMGEAGTNDYAIEIVGVTANCSTYIDFTTPGVDYYGRILYLHGTSGNAMTFSTNSTERMRINSVGSTFHSGYVTANGYTSYGPFTINSPAGTDQLSATLTQNVTDPNFQIGTFTGSGNSYGDNVGSLGIYYWGQTAMSSGLRFYRNGTYGDTEMGLFTGQQERIRINTSGYTRFNGNVGINGTASYPLYVGGSLSENLAGSGWAEFDYGVWNGGTYYPNTVFRSISIRCEEAIMAQLIMALSDKRFKKNITTIDDKKCLDVVNSIDVVKYSYKDFMKNPEKEITGFIAQQVKEIYPEATSTFSDFQPNIYRPFKIKLTNKIVDISNSNYDSSENKINYLYFYELYDSSTNDVSNDSSGIYQNCRLRLYDASSNRIDVSVNEVSDTSCNIVTNNELLIHTDQSGNDVIFVFGTYSTDLINISKERLFALNFGATQELHSLHKEQQIIIDSQKQTINDLQTTVQTQTQKIDDLQTQLNNLTQMFQNYINSHP